MTVGESTAFEAVASGFASGLTGVIGVRILDNEGATTTARTTAGITEYPASSGVYTVTLTAPMVQGNYTIMWDSGVVSPATVALEELLVVSINAALIAAGGNLYVTASQLKTSLNIGSTYADDDIDVAVAAASRAVDGYCDDRFYPTTETRYYTVDPSENFVRIDSLNALTSVTVDTDGNGSYETTWSLGTDFLLNPANASPDGIPWNEIALLRQTGRVFPPYQNSVKIVGSFGWSEIPPGVAQATTILAGRLLKRARETPYGIVVVSGEAVAAARLGRIDPDVAFLLDNIRGTVPLLAI